MGGTSLAAIRRKRVPGRFRRNARALCELLNELVTETAGKNKMLDVSCAYTRVFKCCFHRPGNDFGKAFVPDPALFPVVIELFGVASEVIDKIDRQAGTAEIRRNDIVRTDGYCCRTIAEIEFL